MGVKLVQALACLGLLAIGIGCEEPGEREPSWTYIHAGIIEANCTTSNCHSNLGSSAIGTAAGGLQLDDREASYLLLTGSPCEGGPIEGEPAGNLVVPGQPESSRLIYLLRGIEVERMPPDMPLPEGEIDLIEQWILEGAPCD